MQKMPGTDRRDEWARPPLAVGVTATLPPRPRRSAWQPSFLPALPSARSRRRSASRLPAVGWARLAAICSSIPLFRAVPAPAAAGRKAAHARSACLHEEPPRRTSARRFADSRVVRFPSVRWGCLAATHGGMSVFAPYRALGLIADEVPFAVQRRGRETYITTSIGKAFKVRSMPRRHRPMPNVASPFATGGVLG